jgi:2,3-bisphosphoglycerate-dependent phosphoglycerate mutase
MELILIRHAEPVRIASGDVDGPADPGLTERGHDQARRLAAWLAVDGLDALVTSPLRRARETAAPLASALDLEPIADPGVSEYDATSGEYIPIEELRAAKDDRWYATIEGRWSDAGGVDPDAFQREVVPAIDALITSHAGERVAVVAHGGVINVYLAHVLGLARPLWFHPEYTSVSTVQASRGGARSVSGLNGIAHLVATRDEVTEGMRR